MSYTFYSIVQILIQRMEQDLQSHVQEVQQQLDSRNQVRRL